MGWSICTDKLEEFVFSQDSTSTDDLVDEMDEGFVDDSMAVPSISEHVLTVGVGAPGVEEQDDEQEEKLLHVFLPHGGKEKRKGKREAHNHKINGLIGISIRPLKTIFRTIKGKAEFMTGI